LPATTTALDRTEFRSIVWLRAVASLMVVWTHLVSIFCHAYGVSWLPLRLVETLLNQPLGLIAGFSVFGVDLFFVISGFVITHAGLRERSPAFAIKRLLRIYPPFLVSLVAAIVTLATYIAVFGHPFPSTVIPSWRKFWDSLWLLNVFFIADRININPVAWTLVLEMVFYVTVFLGLPLLKRRPLLPVAAQIVLYAVCLWIYPFANDGVRHFVTTYTSMFLLYQGQALYLVWSKRIGWLSFLAIWTTYYALYVTALHTVQASYYRAEPLVVQNAVMAFALFVALLSADSRLPLPRIVRFFSDISYSLYLNHAVPGFILLAVLYPHVGYTSALTVSFAGCVVLSALSFKLVEQPSQRLARWLAGTIRFRP
jgi:peptidoglycan/LPS O-acetylase OafA/YrhL